MSSRRIDNTKLKPEQVDQYSLSNQEQLNLLIERMSLLQGLLKQAMLRQKVGEQIDVNAITRSVDEQLEFFEAEVLLIQAKMDLERQAIEDLKKKNVLVRWVIGTRSFATKMAGAFKNKK